MSARLGELTTEQARALAARGFVALLPVGSVEPHGPHLPLATDSIISEAASLRAVELLGAEGVVAKVAPSIPYGVTEFASGFAGALTVPAAALGTFIRAVTDALLASGATHVCVVNNHLEPAQDAAVRAAVATLPRERASVACPLTRRWARTLSAEFKSGACHAGRYETAIVLAARGELVDREVTGTLPAVPISLSEGIAAGKHTFREMGLDRAYAGAPAEATAVEGEEQLERLAEMIRGEVLDATRGPSGA